MAIQIVKSLIVLNLWNQMKECQKIHNRKIHPTGFEPATKASEAYVYPLDYGCTYNIHILAQNTN